MIDQREDADLAGQDVIGMKEPRYRDSRPARQWRLRSVESQLWLRDGDPNTGLFTRDMTKATMFADQQAAELAATFMNRQAGYELWEATSVEDLDEPVFD